MRFGLILTLVLLLFSLGCSSISETKGKAIALDFVKERGKFFTNSEGNISVVNDYKFTVSDSKDSSGDYVVRIKIQSESTGKSANVTIDVNKYSGKVTKVNNVPFKQ